MRLLLIALLMLATGPALAATPLNAQSKKLLVANLMVECFDAYRKAMPEHISNLDIVNICECASEKSAARMTKEDVESKNQDKLVKLMELNGNICAYQIIVPASLK